jgi:hypothetical protein
VHKRLIFVATTAVLIAAVDCLPFAVVHRIPNGGALFSYGLSAMHGGL